MPGTAYVAPLGTAAPKMIVKDGIFEPAWGAPWLEAGGTTPLQCASEFPGGALDGECRWLLGRDVWESVHGPDDLKGERRALGWESADHTARLYAPDVYTSDRGRWIVLVRPDFGMDQRYAFHLFVAGTMPQVPAGSQMPRGRAQNLDMIPVWTPLEEIQPPPPQWPAASGLFQQEPAELWDDNEPAEQPEQPTPRIIGKRPPATLSDMVASLSPSGREVSGAWVVTTTMLDHRLFRTEVVALRYALDRDGSTVQYVQFGDKIL